MVAWINVIAGIWILLSGFWNLNPWNFLIMGIVVATIGFWNQRGQWQGIVNGLLGLWLVLSSFILTLRTPANLWVTGLIIAVLAIWRLVDTQRRLPSHG
jgi:hypothetical protein